MHDWWISHQATVGVFLGPIATLGASLAGFFKSKGDRYAESAAPSEKRWFYFWWFILTLACLGLSGLSGRISQQSGQAALKQAQATNLQTMADVDDLKIKLGLAVHTNSVAISQAKIQAIQDEFENLAKNTLGASTDQKRLYSQLKAAQSSVKKKKADDARAHRVQESSECFPAFSFTVGYVQGALNALGQTAGRTNVITKPVILPESIYPEDMGDNHLWSVRVSSNTVWQFEVNTGSRDGMPGSGYHDTFLILKFHRNDGHEDLLTVQINNAGTKMYVYFETELLVPDPKKITGEYDLQNFEIVLKPLLSQVITAEWMDADESP